MAVRANFPWPWRAVVVMALVGIAIGLWWEGAGFGPFPGGFNRQEVAVKLASLETEAAQLRQANAQLRARSSLLESDLAMTQGAQSSLSRQAVELQNENSQLKEELGFLQKLMADSNRPAGVAIARLTAERERDDLFHFSMLVVRGGNPADDFDGRVTLQATLQPGGMGPVTIRPVFLALPEDEPVTTAALKLKFKYYQRVEGFFHAPSGMQLRSLTARAFETGQNNPRASRSLNFP